MTKTVISLTAIPSRFKGLGPTLESFRNQTAQIDEICLYIPKSYRRDEFNPYDMPDLPDWCELRVIEEDYGPASKVLGAVKHYWGRDDVRILYGDDDRIYHPDWASKLIEQSDKNPEACIAGYAKSVAEFLHHKNRKLSKGPAYRAKRILSLGLWKPRKPAKIDGPTEFAIGFCGALVKPTFFTENVFDIPDILWTVDDIWLSGNMRANSVEIIGVENGRELSSDNQGNKVDELRKMTYQDHNRHHADLACFEYYQKNFNIWQDGQNEA